MPTRAEILHALTSEHEKFLDHYQTLTPAALEQPCTPSEVPGSALWTPKDHLAHLVMIERTFQRIVRHALRGDADPVGFSRSGAKDRAGVYAWINQNNQKYIDTHHTDSLETILSDFMAVRQDTLALLEQLTDEQLATPLPNAPWSDGTIGGILITNAHHEHQHQQWVDEGLQHHTYL